MEGTPTGLEKLTEDEEYLCETVRFAIYTESQDLAAKVGGGDKARFTAFVEENYNRAGVTRAAADWKLAHGTLRRKDGNGETFGKVLYNRFLREADERFAISNEQH